MWPCLVPIVLLGQIITLPVNSSHTSNIGGQVIEAQTCPRGFGLNAKAAPEPGLYGGGFQYGIELYDTGAWSSTFLTKTGLSYASTPYRELPLRSQFEIGTQFLVTYESLVVGVEWWHLSNAGLRQPNIGLDMILLQSGWVF